MEDWRVIKDVQPIRDIKLVNDMVWALRRHCSERDAFMFQVGINTGLRVSDILPLKVKDVRGKQYLMVKAKKTEKIQRVSLKPIEKLIADYTKHMNDEDYLFPSRKGHKPITKTQAYRALNKAADVLELESVGTHTMRKTFGYHHYKKNQDVAKLMKIFNHSHPEITKAYIGITDDEIDESLEGFGLGLSE